MIDKQTIDEQVFDFASQAKLDIYEIACLRHIIKQSYVFNTINFQMLLKFSEANLINRPIRIDINFGKNIEKEALKRLIEVLGNIVGDMEQIHGCEEVKSRLVRMLNL